MSWSSEHVDVNSDPTMRSRFSRWFLTLLLGFSSVLILGVACSDNPESSTQESGSRSALDPGYSAPKGHILATPLPWTKAVSQSRDYLTELLPALGADTEVVQENTIGSLASEPILGPEPLLLYRVLRDRQRGTGWLVTFNRGVGDLRIRLIDAATGIQRQLSLLMGPQEDRDLTDQERAKIEEMILALADQRDRLHDQSFGDSWKPVENEWSWDAPEDEPFPGFRWKYSSEESLTRIEFVYQSSPAWEAGLRHGDHLIAVNGVKIEKAVTLVTALKSPEIGEMITITIEREGAESSIEFVMAPKRQVILDWRKESIGLKVQEFFADIVPKGSKVEPISFASLRGKLVLVQVFSTFRANNADAFTVLEALKQKYPEEVAIVAIGSDRGRESLQALTNVHGLGWPIAFDPHQVIRDAMRVDKTSEILLVDRQGSIRLRNLQSDELWMAVRTLLSDKTGSGEGQ